MTLIKLLIIAFILTNLVARENPFFPSEGEKDIAYTSNKKIEAPLLQRATLTLPPEARVVESVTFYYKNLDGSQAQKTLSLNNAIDWHLPLFISQSYTESTKTSQTDSQKEEFIKVASIKFASFYTSHKTLKIETKDKLIRHFALVEPHRIIVDFQRDSSLKSYEKQIPNNIFSKIRVGNHDGYYRAVIELDGFYKYSFNESSNTYIFELK